MNKLILRRECGIWYRLGQPYRFVDRAGSMVGLGSVAVVIIFALVAMLCG